jgi:flagellar hook-basal body complex protein FliE
MSEIAIQQVLAQIRTLQAQSAGQLGHAPGAAPVSGTSFAEVLRRGIDEVNARQQHASQLVTRFEQGEAGLELPQVMIEAQKASVSFRALVEVRNRFISAYQDIMNMPI